MLSLTQAVSFRMHTTPLHFPSHFCCNIEIPFHIVLLLLPLAATIPGHPLHALRDCSLLTPPLPQDKSKNEMTQAGKRTTPSSFRQTALRHPSHCVTSASDTEAFRFRSVFAYYSTEKYLLFFHTIGIQDSEQESSGSRCAAFSI